MDNFIYRTKPSLFGLIISFLILIITIFLTVINMIDGKMNILLLILLLVTVITVFLMQLNPSVILVFYKDYFIVRYPFLRFLRGYRDRCFRYLDIDIVQYRYKLREPNHLEIKLKSGKTKNFWYRFRYFSKDKESIGDILDSKNITFQFRRFNMIKRYNEKEWKNNKK